MINKNIFKDLESTYASQSKIFYGESINLLNFNNNLHKPTSYIFYILFGVKIHKNRKIWDGA